MDKFAVVISLASMLQGRKLAGQLIWRNTTILNQERCLCRFVFSCGVCYPVAGLSQKQLVTINISFDSGHRVAYFIFVASREVNSLWSFSAKFCLMGYLVMLRCSARNCMFKGNTVICTTTTVALHKSSWCNFIHWYYSNKACGLFKLRFVRAMERGLSPLRWNS